MIQTNKALLAVLAIVIAVGFVAANVTPQASAQGGICPLTLINPHFSNGKCTGNGQPHFDSVPPQFIHTH